MVVEAGSFCARAAPPARHAAMIAKPRIRIRRLRMVSSFVQSLMSVVPAFDAEYQTRAAGLKTAAGLTDSPPSAVSAPRPFLRSRDFSPCRIAPPPGDRAA